jgi:glycosyltransferase involved in cell wall biosynthesis
VADIRTIAVCYPQVPFSRGGAELHVRSLCEQLERRGYLVDPVSLPFRWTPADALLDQFLSWRMLDLRESNGVEIDRVIATKFPSYTVSHPNKITWLFHQFRQVYDLLGTEYSHFGRTPEDITLCEQVRRTDCRTISESQRIYTLSETVSKRLKDFNDIDSEPLYHPPPRHDQFRRGPTGNYILSLGRLDKLKRVEPLIRAMPLTDPSLRCVICGTGPERDSLIALADELGVSDRIDFAGAVSFQNIIELYSGCLAVYFAPFQEDYGYVTLEAFLSRKPVVTAPDSGAPTEFVEDGETGFVVELDSEKLAERLRDLDDNRSRSAAMGEAGFEKVRLIDWEPVIDKLVAP